MGGSNYAVGVASFGAVVLGLGWSIPLMSWCVLQETQLYGFPSVRSWNVDASLWTVSVRPNCQTSVPNHWAFFRAINTLSGHNKICGKDKKGYLSSGKEGAEISQMFETDHSIFEMQAITCSIEQQARSIGLPIRFGCDSFKYAYFIGIMTGLLWITTAMCLLCGAVNTLVYYKWDQSMRRRRIVLLFYSIAPIAALLGVAVYATFFNLENAFYFLGTPPKGSVWPLTIGSVLVLFLTVGTLVDVIAVFVFIQDMKEEVIYIGYDATAMYGSEAYAGEAKPDQSGIGYSYGSTASTYAPQSGATGLGQSATASAAAGPSMSGFAAYPGADATAAAGTGYSSAPPYYGAAESASATPYYSAQP